MLDYDREADRYDRSRGGEPRADAAAEAIEQLLPGGVRLLVDVACGTGIVTARLRRPDRTVLGVDRSAGMIAKASVRLPEHVVIGDATALPLATGRADAVLMVWLLHLVPNPEDIIAEAARVLGPAGRIVTTVEKNAGSFATASDLAEITGPHRRRHAPAPADGHDRIVTAARRHELHPAGEQTFRGLGQGRTPRQWIAQIRAGAIGWAAPTDPQTEALCHEIASLPDQDIARADPLYRLIALTR